MSKRWLLVAASVAGTLTVILIYLLTGRETASQHQFLSLVQSQRSRVSSTVYDDLLIFRNNLGAFTIPTRCSAGGDAKGVGYVTAWTAPNGEVLAAATPSGTSSSANYLNDSGVGVGLGAVGMYLLLGPGPSWRYWDMSWPDAVPQSISMTTGTRMCRWPGIGWVGHRQVTASSYQQDIVLLRGRILATVRWTFTNNTVEEEVALQFLHQQAASAPRAPPTGPYYVKEPQVAVSLTGGSIQTVSFPDTTCHSYSGLVNPARRTGRCEDPARQAAKLAGGHDYTVAVDDRSWRVLSADAQHWQRAGVSGCQTPHGYDVNPFPNWELTARAPSVQAAYSSLALLLKSEEGCVSGQDAYAFFVAPKTPSRVYRIMVAIRAT